MRIGRSHVLKFLFATGFNPWLIGCALKYPASFDNQLSKMGATGGGTSTTSACIAAVASDSLTMVCVPANTAGLTIDDTAIELTHTVASITAFAMAKYEVKYADWLTVKTWAQPGNGYTFANPGMQGNSGGGTPQHPVTQVNWRDAIIWCNAASQKDGLTPVYYTDAGLATPLKTATNSGGVNVTAGSQDNPYMNWSANGYRLPTEAEWEYAARYKDGVSFTPGDYASGATAIYSTFAASDLVAWFGNIVNGITGNTITTQPVGTKGANLLGIFDMSGNVHEWVYDWYAAYSGCTGCTGADPKGPTSGAGRVYRGGSWNSSAANLRGALRSIFDPWDATSNSLGFRPVRRP